MAKFPWYAAPEDLELKVEGRRVDGQEGSVTADVSPGSPESGFDDTFWQSEVTFPSNGCWQVTGTTDSSELTFVVEIIGAVA